MKNEYPDGRKSHVKKLAEWLDNRFTIPGTDIKFGLDPLIGLIPGLGDWFTGIISSYFILLGVRADLAPSVIWRMGFNVLLDVVIGSIPVLGDIFDIGWKSNLKNAELLERYRKDADETERHSKLLLGAIAIFLIILVIALVALISWAFVQIFQAIF